MDTVRIQWKGLESSQEAAATVRIQGKELESLVETAITVRIRKKNPRGGRESSGYSQDLRKKYVRR